MPILDVDGVYENKEELENKRVYRTQEEMKTSTLYHKEVPLKNIIQYIKGMKWTVDYFKQVIDVNDTTTAPDVNIPATTQKYHRINKLILTIQSSIQQENLDSITGEAIVNAGFLVNVDDIFLATLTGGREAIFIITEKQIRTYNLHQAYYITFKLFNFCDDNPEVYNDLIRKVIKEYVYDKDHLLDFGAPTILQTDYKKKLDLKDKVAELLDYYMTRFVNEQSRVISPPTQGGVYTDQLLSNFLFKIVNQSDHLVMGKLTNIDTTYVQNVKLSVLDVILKRDLRLLKQCDKRIGFRFNPYGVMDAFNKQSNIHGIHFIVDKLNQDDPGVIPDIVELEYDRDFETYYRPRGVMGDKYIFSEAFYNQDKENCGTLEFCLLEYLEGKIVPLEKLEHLIEQYYAWDTIEQFYLIPILIVLVKDSINNTFKSL